jgi:hypothetical protein
VSLFDVAILGFRLNTSEPPEKALVRVFGIAPETARALLKSFPVLVKRRVPLEVAQQFQEALMAIGARVELRPHSLSVPPADARPSLPASALAPAVEPPAEPSPPIDPGFDWSSALPDAAGSGKRVMARVIDPLQGASIPVPPSAETRASQLVLEQHLAARVESSPPLELVSLPPRFRAAGLADNASNGRTTAFAADLALPWVDPPTGRQPREPGGEVGPLPSVPAPAPRAAVQRPQPAPFVPDRELPEAVQRELAPDAYARFAPYAPILPLALGALVCISLGGGLLKLLGPLLALLAAVVWLHHSAVRAELDGVLEPANRPLPELTRHLASYQRWLRHRGFSAPTLFRTAHDSAILAVHTHDEGLAHLVLYLAAPGVRAEFVTGLAGQGLLRTRSAPFALPPGEQVFAQSFATLQLDALYEKHSGSLARLEQNESNVRERSAAYSTLHSLAVRKTRAALAKNAIWPLFLPLWRHVPPVPVERDVP